MGPSSELGPELGFVERLVENDVDAGVVMLSSGEEKGEVDQKVPFD